MPDHMHMVWMGLFSGCDQLNAMKHFRLRCHESLELIGYGLQDQAYDHVLKEEERREEAFRELCNYIARNPERAAIVEPDGYATYSYSGCLVPGYPELKPFDSDYWNQFDRIVSRLRQRGMQQLNP
ncbi:hypothetical protein [Crateriforma spongiae]|uniref:hypothetical protein n=1 Tax=Crateriforma spongiae TaxID=2724528 RepID=UPI001F23F009|nr:hypothetical protein [Crateriforma spongiae]